MTGSATGLAGLASGFGEELFLTLTVIVLSARYRMLFVVSVPMGSIGVKSVMMAIDVVKSESIKTRNAPLVR